MFVLRHGQIEEADHVLFTRRVGFNGAGTPAGCVDRACDPLDSLARTAYRQHALSLRRKAATQGSTWAHLRADADADADRRRSTGSRAHAASGGSRPSHADQAAVDATSRYQRERNG